jgi:hypothetical protein
MTSSCSSADISSLLSVVSSTLSFLVCRTGSDRSVVRSVPLCLDIRLAGCHCIGGRVKTSGDGSDDDFFEVAGGKLVESDWDVDFDCRLERFDALIAYQNAPYAPPQLKQQVELVAGSEQRRTEAT